MPMTITQKLLKTRASINAHRNRGQGLGENGNINYRGCDLCDRYDDLKRALIDTEGYPAWKVYCDNLGSDPRHGGHDLFS